MKPTLIIPKPIPRGPFKRQVFDETALKEFGELVGQFFELFGVFPKRTNRAKRRRRKLRSK